MTRSSFPLPTDQQRDAFDVRFMKGVDWIVRGFQRHWLFIFNAATFLLLASSFLTAALYVWGMDDTGDMLRRFYFNSGICVSPNKYFLFGYATGMCQRNTAIFLSMFLAGLGYAGMRRFLPPLSLKLFFLLILPIVIDGVTQLFGWRESDWLLRTITGALFGFASVWFIYPRFDIINTREVNRREVMPGAE